MVLTWGLQVPCDRSYWCHNHPRHHPHLCLSQSAVNPAVPNHISAVAHSGTSICAVPELCGSYMSLPPTGLTPVLEIAACY